MMTSAYFVAASTGHAQTPPVPPMTGGEAIPAASARDTDEHPLSWHGITIYGAFDLGIGWVSHGLPENGANYEGESLVNKNGNSSRFVAAQNNLSQTGIGIRGKEKFANGWSFIFNASTGINPQSGQLANMAATNTLNNGLPRSSYSYVGDGARAGQAFNDELFAGVSSGFGALTFGRQRALGTDVMLAYDPANGSYAFSFVGYNGLAAGGGDTQNTRWDNALKYRIARGPVHAGAIYKFASGRAGCYSAAATWTAATCVAERPHNSAAGVDFGGTYGRFSADVVYQRVNQAISVVNPLLGPTSRTDPFQSTTDSINQNPISGVNLINPADTEAGIVTDNQAIMVAGKYTTDTLKLYAAYEHILYKNPKHPLGVGASAQGGYLLSSVEDDNLDSPKKVQVFWTGIKITMRKKTDLTLAYYHEYQNDFRVPATCSAIAGYRSSCAGKLNEISFYADHRLIRHLDLYAGVSFSEVSGGLAIAVPHGPGIPYYANDNLAPTLGARFSF